jgi:hypothetical protein
MNIITESQLIRAYTFNTDLLPDDDEGEQFAQRIYSMIVEYAELTTRKRESDILNWSSKHEAKLMEHTQLIEQKAELEAEQGLLAANVEVRDRDVSNSRFELKVIREQTPGGMWASESSRKAHNVRVAHAEQVLQEAIHRQAEHNEAVAGWREKWTKLSDQIATVSDEVRQMWGKLESARGHKVFNVDQNTGLRI